MYQLACALWSPMPKCHHCIECLQMTYWMPLLEDEHWEFSVVSLELTNCSAPFGAHVNEQVYWGPILCVMM